MKLSEITSINYLVSDIIATNILPLRTENLEELTENMEIDNIEENNLEKEIPVSYGNKINLIINYNDIKNSKQKLNFCMNKQQLSEMIQKLEKTQKIIKKIQEN